MSTCYVQLSIIQLCCVQLCVFSNNVYSCAVLSDAVLSCAVLCHLAVLEALDCSSLCYPLSLYVLIDWPCRKTAFCAVLSLCHSRSDRACYHRCCWSGSTPQSCCLAGAVKGVVPSASAAQHIRSSKRSCLSQGLFTPMLSQLLIALLMLLCRCSQGCPPQRLCSAACSCMAMCDSQSRSTISFKCCRGSSLQCYYCSAGAVKKYPPERCCSVIH